MGCSLNVVKRNGIKVSFDRSKLENAIECAFDIEIEDEKIKNIVECVLDGILDSGKTLISTEEINDHVEKSLMSLGYYNEARNFILYREQNKNIRKMSTDNNTMSEYIFMNRYSNYLPRKRRRETWNEAVDRVRDMHIAKYPIIEDDILWAFEQVRQKRVLPSMRSMQFAGKPIESKPERIYNCTASPCDRVEFFSQTMELLLAGCGVGFDVTFESINKLPKFIIPDVKKIEHITIEDSIEGWSDAIDSLISSYVTGTTVEFIYKKIRKAGSKIKSGGNAPGHVPLRRSIEKIRNIMDNIINRDGIMKPIEAYDIIMHIADAVLSGGVRRSATICLFSPEDDLMMNAKTGNWFEENPQRGRSNNSVKLIRNNTTFEQFKQIFNKQKEFGEPGFYFVNDNKYLTNPCCEIGLNAYLPKGYKLTSGKILEEESSGFSFCVAGDTKLITKTGIINIEDSVGTEIEIWNGESWSKTKPFLTGTEDELHRVWFSDGSYLDATNNHKFIVKQSHHQEYREVELIDLIELLDNTKGGWHIPRSNIKYTGGVVNDNAYDYGFILGDGCIRQNDKCVYTTIYHGSGKSDLPLSIECINENDKSLTYRFVDVDVEYSRNLKYSIGLSSDIFTWNRDSILRFIAGWADADGSVASKGIRIYGREDKIRDGQLLLSKVGINSSVNLMGKSGEYTNIGVRRNDVWYLQITKTNDIPCKRLLCNNIDDNKYKGKYQYISSIESIKGRHKSYCLNEEKLHKCVFNNVLTKQCNLTTINGSLLESIDDFKIAVKAATIIGTCQAGYNTFKYHGEITEEIVKRESLLGVSITGIMDRPEITLVPETLQSMAKYAIEINKKISKKIGINSSARITTIKPEGSSSILLNTASGIHPRYAKKYFRRIQANINDPVYQHFKLNNPQCCEPSIWSTNGTDDVITFCVTSPEGAITKDDISAIEFLKIVKLVQANWVIPGTAKPDSSPGLTHNVSNTCTVKDDEWDEVCSYIYENREYFTGISLISDNGDMIYDQAPHQTIRSSDDEVTWSNYLESYEKVDYTKLNEEEDNTNLKEIVACGANGCELK